MADKFISAQVEEAKGHEQKVSLYGGSPGTQGRTLDEVQSKFISCAVVRGTSFVDLHIISARWQMGSRVRESQTALLEDQSQAPLARAVCREWPMSCCLTTLI
jgi:hypothetical protein